MDSTPFIKTLIDGIIDDAAENGVKLSPGDVSDIAIYNLYSIVKATNTVETDAVKTEINNMVGDPDKVAEYLFTTLNGITAANDEWIDKEFTEKGGINGGF